MTPQEQYETILAWDDLVVAGRPAKIDQFFSEVDGRLPPEWSRDLDAEAEAAAKGFSLPRSRCYTRQFEKRRIVLWLLRVSDRRVQGGLVESSELARYLHDNSSAILEFLDSVLKPAATACRLEVGRNGLGPHSLVPAGVKDALWSFFDYCEFEWPPTGESLRRWRHFVACSYRDGAAFDADELRSWFIEKGWKREQADALFERLVADAAMLEELDDLRQPA